MDFLSSKFSFKLTNIFFWNFYEILSSLIFNTLGIYNGIVCGMDVSLTFLKRLLHCAFVIYQRLISHTSDYRQHAHRALNCCIRRSFQDCSVLCLWSIPHCFSYEVSEFLLDGLDSFNCLVFRMFLVIIVHQYLYLNFRNFLYNSRERKSDGYFYFNCFKFIH